jgi:tight adherence protein C
MFTNPIAAAAVAFFVVSAGMIALGYLLTLGRGDGKAALRLRQLGAAPTPTAPLTAPAKAGAGVVPALLNRLARVGGVGTARKAELRAQCLRAGFFHPSALSMFIGTRILLILTLAIGGAVVSFYFLPASGNAKSGADALARVPLSTKVCLCALAGAAVGMLAPSFWLSSKVRKRQQLLRNALADALDMLVLCLEGGVSLNAAMQRVTDELQIAHPLLAMEMNIVQREMQLGLSAGEALRKFSERCGLSDVHDLALTLLQSERYGSSITKALRGYVEAARLERQQQVEEVAQKAAVKILFPTLLCIFPAIFVVVLGPAAFQMAKLFSR